jgi:hypothetical protein
MRSWPGLGPTKDLDDSFPTRLPLSGWRFGEQLPIMPNSAQNSMANNSQSDIPRPDVHVLLRVTVHKALYR